MIISLTHHILLSIQELEQSEATIPPQLIEYMPEIISLTHNPSPVDRVHA